jgi:hypothetical protein
VRLAGKAGGPPVERAALETPLNATSSSVRRPACRFCIAAIFTLL